MAGWLLYSPLHQISITEQIVVQAPIKQLQNHSGRSLRCDSLPPSLSLVLCLPVHSRYCPCCTESHLLLFSPPFRCCTVHPSRDCATMVRFTHIPSLCTLAGELSRRSIRTKNGSLLSINDITTMDFNTAPCNYDVIIDRVQTSVFRSWAWVPRPAALVAIGPHCLKCLWRGRRVGGGICVSASCAMLSAQFFSSSLNPGPPAAAEPAALVQICASHGAVFDLAG